MISLSVLLLFSTLVNANAAEPLLLFANDVNPIHAELLNADIQLLGTFPQQSVDSNFTQVTDIPGPVISGPLLLEWLKVRVRYIVGESFNSQENIYVERRKYAFQNPGLIPKFPGEDKVRSTSVSRMIMMQNLGAAYYYAGKTDAKLYGLNIKGIDKIPLSSPRVGFLQIGPGLFQAPSNAKLTDPHVRLERIFTLFHEARHGDGNGHTLGMMHYYCPSGHSYSGYPACDFNLNGSYSVELQIRKALTEACAGCTVAQKERLRLGYLDTYSRILLENRSESDRLREIEQRRACEELKKYPVHVPMCEELANKDKNPKAILKAEFWDSRPEGVIEKHKGFFDFLFFI